jgi:hypothetical protein
MWSDKYNYYNIQSDESHSEEIESRKVIEILTKTTYFKQINHQSFSNCENFPWLEINIVKAKNGNFSTSEKELESVNLITIVCSKNMEINQSIYTETFLNIAKELNWKLYLEQDDEENQNIEIKRE